MTYFTFNTHVSTGTVDRHASTKSLTRGFSLHLLQSLSNSDVKTTVTSYLVKTLSQPVADREFTLKNLSDKPNQMRIIVINARNTIAPVSPTPSSLVKACDLFSTPTTLSSMILPSSSTPKMDRPIAFSSGVVTFTGALNYLDSQTSFDAIVGVDPTILCLTFRNKGQCTTEDTEHLAFKVLALCNLCRFHICCIKS